MKQLSTARRFGFGVALAALVIASEARAGLAADVARLERALGVQGHSPARLEPLFAFRGEPAARSLPAHAGEGARCRSIIALADRQVRFAVSWAPRSAGSGAPGGSLATGGSEAGSAESALGVAVVHDCGPKAGRDRVHVAMLSPRAAVELVAVWHDGPLAPLGVLLPERRLAPAAGSDGSSFSSAPPAMAARLAEAESQARLDGAAMVVRVPYQAEARGQGAIRLRLPPGCHRLHVVAERAESAAMAHDLDAEIARGPEGTLLAQDRSVAPDARLEACVAESTAVDLRFVGAPARASVTLLDAIWPLPLPPATAWDAPTREAMGSALWQARAPRLEGAPVVESVGAQGTTLVPLALAPGCYVAVLALTAGRGAALRLSVNAGETVGAEAVAPKPLGAAVAFCVAERSDAVRAQVELRASLAWWRLAVWRAAGAPP